MKLSVSLTLTKCEPKKYIQYIKRKQAAWGGIQSTAGELTRCDRFDFLIFVDDYIGTIAVHPAPYYSA